MKRKIIKSFIISAVILTIIMVILCISISEHQKSDNTGYELVDLNEIEKLHETGNNKDFHESVDSLRSQLSSRQDESNSFELISLVIVIYVTFLSGGAIIYLYIYIKILRPFDKMKDYAMEIAQGNMEATFMINRENYFGDFTWAFDHMRNEIVSARKSEKAAVENNKTVIATLSHDIKTPIASIRAYCEALEANMDQNPERRKRYTSVITRKCDEVTRLTNDLFVHSIADMNRLTFLEEKVDFYSLLSEVVAESAYGSNIIRINDQISGVCVAGDRKRIAQVFENIFSNSSKYAPGSPIDISIKIIEEKLLCCVRDYGKGIPAADMPFITEKFYRGKNAGDQPGSGLGLYIVNYIMQNMDGKANIMSHEDGLEIRLEFTIVS